MITNTRGAEGRGGGASMPLGQDPCHGQCVPSPLILRYVARLRDAIFGFDWTRMLNLLPKEPKIPYLFDKRAPQCYVIGWTLFKISIHMDISQWTKRMTKEIAFLPYSFFTVSIEPTRLKPLSACQICQPLASSSPRSAASPILRWISRSWGWFSCLQGWWCSLGGIGPPEVVTVST